ncbi:MAG: TonB-dependent receptor [Bacteroidales bacterium]|nr:TonB-dependent receptor [Bacteroidales bacterium]
MGNPSQDIFIDGKFTKEEYTAVNPGYELKLDYTFNESFYVVTGILYETQSLRNYSVQRNYQIIGDEYIGAFGNHDNVSLDQKDKKRELFAYYLEVDYKFKSLILTTGIRYDKYSDFGESYNPRLGIVYKPFKNFSLKALYGEAFRAPTFKELYDRTNIGTDGVFGNINLYPEKISTSELGIEFNQTHYILRTNAFYNKNDDIIQIYDPEGGGAAASYENIGNTESIGYEIEVISTINKNFSVFANFSQFSRKFEWSNEDVISDDIITYLNEKGYKCLRNSPTIRLNVGLDFMFSKFHCFAGINYGGESMNNDRQAIEGLRFVHIDPYLLGNFKIEYLFNNNFKWLCFISLWGNYFLQRVNLCKSALRSISVICVPLNIRTRMTRMQATLIIADNKEH